MNTNLYKAPLKGFEAKIETITFKEETFTVLANKYDGYGTYICLALDKDGIPWSLTFSDNSNGILCTKLESNGKDNKIVTNDN